MRKILYILLLPTLLLAQYSNDKGTMQNYFQVGKSIVSVRNYGADNTGATDCSSAFIKAFTKAGSGIVYLPEGKYKLTSAFTLDCNNDSVTFIGLPGSKIISMVTSGGSYYNHVGALKFKNAKSLVIKGLVLECRNSGLNYVSGIVDTNCAEVIYENVKVTGASYIGSLTIGAGYLIVNDCSADSNQYAGRLVLTSTGGKISGGHYNYNGNFWTRGYGISLSGRLAGVDNKQFTIENVIANYNTRKGIDVHNCKGVIINNCHIKGFGVTAIYAVNEEGNPGTEKVVENVTISNCIIENDSLWTTTFATDWNTPILLGGYDDPTEGGGSFILSNIIMKNLNIDSLRAPIYFFTNTTGLQIENIIINNISIKDARPTFQDPYTGIKDAIIQISGTIDPKKIDISNCDIEGVDSVGINIMCGNQVSISHCNFSGTFTQKIVVNPDKPRLITDNTYSFTDGGYYRSIKLPDYYSNYSGRLILSGSTSISAPLVFNSLIVPYDIYEDGRVSCKIKLIYQMVTSPDILTYEYTVWCGNDSHVLTTGVVLLSANNTINQDPDLTTYKPSLSWTGIGATRTLAISLPIAYAGYQIIIDFTSWRITPYM